MSENITITGESDDGATLPQSCRVAVIIINYQTAELTIGCVQSAAGQLEENDARVVVVDNCSSDGSAEKIERWINASPIRDRCVLVRAGVNGGFAAGNNLGVKALEAPFYLLLNSDARLRPGALKTLLNAAQTHKHAGAIAPRLEDEDGTPQQSCFRFASALSEFAAGAQSGPISAFLRKFEVALPVSKQSVECAWASFACILLRADAMEQAGAFDEGYFMYFEDADYCHELARNDWRIVYEPSARAVHLRGGSSPVKEKIARKERPPAYYYASRTRFFRKIYGPAGLYVANFMWLAGRALAYLRPLTGKSVPKVCDKRVSDIWMNWRDQLGDPKAPVTATGENAK